MAKIMISLEDRDLLDLHEVLLDDDAPAALAFLRERLVPQLPRKGAAPCDSSRLNPYLLKPDPHSGS